MFYRLVSLSLVVLGVLHIILGISSPLSVDETFLHYSGVGLAMIFLGLLNFSYLYETPQSKVPQFVLLSANILFIGFSILLVTNDTDLIHSWVAIVLSVFNSVMVLNHKV
ncbi:MAG: hypothetical protein AAFQ02_12890 [Bacteroidota bacterium]